MSKKESTFLNMVLTLVIVASVAAFTLASIYNVTKGPIAEAREAAKQLAISQVVPDFDELITKKFKEFDGNDSLEFNLAYKNNELVGIAVATYTNRGFSGAIRAMAGFYPDGVIYDVVHLEHAETPGLGDKIEKSKSDWSDQFIGFDPSEKSLIFEDGDVDEITAATITAVAYCDAINRAYQTFMENREEIIRLSSPGAEAQDSADNEDNELITQKEGE